jgi:hypothetical protein
MQGGCSTSGQLMQMQSGRLVLLACSRVQLHVCRSVLNSIAALLGFAEVSPLLFVKSSSDCSEHLHTSVPSVARPKFCPLAMLYCVIMVVLR